jgi:large subunit ribosomal protein L24
VNLNIKKGDTVYVLAGRSRMKRLTPEESAKVPEIEKKKVAEHHAGRRGQVLRVLPSQGKVVVEGANLVTKHNRKGASGRLAQQQAGRIEQPSPMPVSKVMLVCPRCDKPTRPYREEREGKRVRICRGCKEIIDSVR